MHPVGPLNPKVYWIRRVAIVVVAVAVLIGLVWFLANRSSRSSGSQPTTPAAAVTGSAAPTLTGVLAASSGPSKSTVPSASPSASGPAVSGSVTPSGSAEASASPPAASGSIVAADPAASPPADPAAVPPADPAATPPPAEPVPPAVPTTEPPAPPAPPPPSYDADGKLLCADGSITITAITSAPSFATGSQPTVGLMVKNSGTEACRRDVSGTLQTFTVLGADGSRKWSTADCFPGEGNEVRDLAPGQELKYTIKWSGSSSEPGCVGDRAPVPPGDYVLVAQLGGLSGAPVPFTITG